MAINSNYTRIFLALPVDKIYHDSLIRLQSELMLDLEHLPHAVRWTQPHRLHLTLFFLGRHTQSDIDRLIQTMKKINLAMLSDITFSCDQVQLFPHTKPTVVALTGKATSSLKLLRQCIAGCLKTAQIMPDLSYESQGFLPHITLGRLEEPTDLKTQLTNVNVHFKQLVLFKSEPIEPPRSPYVTHTPLYTLYA